jgi:hypothetical protein
MSDLYPTRATFLALDAKYGSSLCIHDQLTREFYQREARVRTSFMVGVWVCWDDWDAARKAANPDATWAKHWDAHGEVQVDQPVQILAFTSAGFRGIEATILVASPRTGKPIIKHGLAIAKLIMPAVLPGHARPHVRYDHDPSIQNQYTS